MRTISQAVEEVIQRSPFLSETMAEGVANNAQIARRIKPEVESRLMEEVSESAISMALHRLEKRLKKPRYGLDLLKSMNDITVRSNLVQYVFPNALRAEKTFEAVSRAAQRNNELFFNIARGLRETLIIVSRDLEREVSEHLKNPRGDAAGVRTDGLSAITVRLPENSLAVPGIYYPILKAIALEGISLVEVTSVRTEFSIIVENKDVDRAFSAIKKLTS